MRMNDEYKRFTMPMQKVLQQFKAGAPWMI